MTAAQVIKLVGKAAVVEMRGDILKLKTAPKPFPDFDTYELFISPDHGVLRMDGRDMNPTATDAWRYRTYLDARDAVTQIYGSPEGGPAANSAGTESVALWDLKQWHPLPAGGVNAIFLSSGHSLLKPEIHDPPLLSFSCIGSENTSRQR
jgi:hypothetical protein